MSFKAGNKSSDILMSLYCFDEKEIHENTMYKLSAIFKLT